ncbi:hypothetical protein HDU85_004522 [Gaertneriomyces sp. JEL0708]|nr:hypothetical protein HDU85_004522 [Gaertneriomyces sp. JEL0708]
MSTLLSQRQTPPSSGRRSSSQRLSSSKQPKTPLTPALVEKQDSASDVKAKDWGWLTEEDLTGSDEELASQIRNRLATRTPPHSVEHLDILTSYHLSMVIHARQCQYPLNVTIPFLALLRRILDSFAISPTKTRDEAIATFQNELALLVEGGIIHVQYGMRIAEVVVESILQHWRLWQAVFTIQQSEELVEVDVQVEQPPEVALVGLSVEHPFARPFSRSAQVLTSNEHMEEKDSHDGRDTGSSHAWPPALMRAVPWDIWEAEQERARKEAERLEEERRRREEEERKAAENPFAVLSKEDVQQIATNTVIKLLDDLKGDVEKAMEDVRTRFLSKIGAKK